MWQFLATASLVFGAWYIGWRWLYSLNTDALWFSVPLIVAETAAYLGLILFVINLWTARSPARPALPATLYDISDDRHEPDRPIRVDFFFATYSEDPELVRLGLQDAKKVSYPHPIEVRIHVLDDGRRAAMAAVAAQEGVNYIARQDNVGFKAGNLRNAMSVTEGDLLVICDADTRPFPNILEETLGYFRDRKLAWVQTPQWFFDIPPGVPLAVKLARRFGRAGHAAGRLIERCIGPVQVGEDPFANDPQLFYDFIQRRRNWANAGFCCGAGSLHRREAVMEAAIRRWTSTILDQATARQERLARHTGESDIGPAMKEELRLQTAIEEEFTPYKFHVSEDIYTSLALHADRERGWKSVMHPVVLSRMLSPNDLLSWTIQRFKYAGGTVDILFHDNPLLRGGLTLPQKLMYAATFYSYFSALWNVIFLISPVVFLLTGIAPVSAYTTTFFLHISFFLLLNELAQLVGLWGISGYRGRAWYLASFPLVLNAWWTVLRGRKIAFPVTPKDRQEGRYLHLVRWQIAICVITLLSLAWGWHSYSAGRDGYTAGAMIANTLWGLNNVYAMSVIIRAAFWKPDPEYDLPVMKGVQ